MSGMEVCRRCHCPLMRLSLSSGKEEQRRVCARCQEKSAARNTQQRRSEQVAAWKEANKERERRILRALKTAGKERTRKKLLIEDAALVRTVSEDYHSRQAQKARSAEDDV